MADNNIKKFNKNTIWYIINLLTIGFSLLTIAPFIFNPNSGSIALFIFSPIYFSAIVVALINITVVVPIMLLRHRLEIKSLIISSILIVFSVLYVEITFNTISDEYEPLLLSFTLITFSLLYIIMYLLKDYLSKHLWIVKFLVISSTLFFFLLLLFLAIKR